MLTTNPAVIVATGARSSDPWEVC